MGLHRHDIVSVGIVINVFEITSGSRIVGAGGSPRGVDDRHDVGKLTHVD
jgi:hypothetical protein